MFHPLIGTSIVIPFSEKLLDLGAFYIPFVMVVIVAVVNAVNLIMESKGNDDLIYSDPVLVIGHVITNLSAYDAVIICTDIEVKAHA